MSASAHKGTTGGGNGPSDKQETDMTEISEIRELSTDELDAVSGGLGPLNFIAAAVLEVAGDVAHALGANGAAYSLYMTAEKVLH